MSTKSAGRRLRENLDKALAAAGREQHRTLEFSEVELEYIGWAMQAVDRAAELRKVYDAELSGVYGAEPRPAVLAKLSAEIRACHQLAAALVGKVDLGTEKVKSPQHVAAGQARWRQSVR